MYDIVLWYEIDDVFVRLNGIGFIINEYGFCGVVVCGFFSEGI